MSDLLLIRAGREWMRKFCIVTILVIILQVCFFIGTGFPYSAEKNYRQVCKKYEGLRYMEARKQVNADRSQISKTDFDRLMKQIDWMENLEHNRVTTYLPESKEEKGYVYVEVPPEKAGMEGTLEEKAIPLFVYQEGYKKMFGIEGEYFHFFQAIIVFVLIMFLYYKKEKITFLKRILHTLIVGGIAYLPELIWILVFFGSSGAGYPGISVGEIGGFPIYGVARITYLVRFFGIFTLEYLILFLNRLLRKRHYVIDIVLFCLYMLPAAAGAVVVFVSKTQIFLCGFSDVLIVTNAMKFSYDYVLILLIIDVVIIAVCRFYPIHHYSESDIKRMELHFKDQL